MAQQVLERSRIKSEVFKVVANAHGGVANPVWGPKEFEIAFLDLRLNDADNDFRGISLPFPSGTLRTLRILRARHHVSSLLSRELSGLTAQPLPVS